MNSSSLKAEVLRLAALDISLREREMALKQAELDVARTKARYRSLLRVSSDLIWTTGDDYGLQIEELPEWQTFTGQTAAELLGFGWASAIHPEDRESTLLAWDFALKTGTTFRIQQRLRRHDGVYRTMKVRAVPSRDAKGNLIEWVGMHTDITDRLEAESTSRQTSEKLQSILSSMTDGMNSVDRDWRFTYINEAGSALLGVRPEEFLGQCVWDLYPYADQSSFGKMMRQAAHTGKHTYTLDYYPEPLNKWLECNFYPSDEGISSYFRDITQRKQAEEAIERSNAELLRTQHVLKSVLAGVTDGVSMLDKDGRYTYINEQGADLLGVRVEDVLGKRIWDVFPEAQMAPFGRMLRQAIETGRPTRNMDFAPEPVNKWLECHIHPTGQGVSICYSDVTEKQLAGEALLQSEKLAMASSLASSIATDLKNPLESAKDLIDQCLTMQLSEAARTNLMQALQQVASASQSSLQSLRFHRNLSVATDNDVSVLLDYALRIFAPRFAAAGIEVERDYSSHPRLNCHAEELRQVFSNLLGNALEFTSSGGTVRLRVRPSRFFGGVLVTVADTGEGIPAALRPRVFDLFTSTKTGRSAGIGLWVSVATIRKHKGRIALRSSTGSATQASGTVFLIFLPYSAAEPPSALTVRKQAGESRGP
jgi:PAS domain S-box-containing protein